MNQAMKDFGQEHHSMDVFLERWGQVLIVTALWVKASLVNGKSVTLRDAAEAISRITAVRGLLRAIPVRKVIELISLANRCGAFDEFGVRLAPFVGFILTNPEEVAQVRSIEPWRRPITSIERNAFAEEARKLRHRAGL